MAVADDVAPTSIVDTPREAIHRLQNFLYIVEDWGTQLHVEFGLHKCKLLITAKVHKLFQVEKLLAEDPGILTFYGTPVSLVVEPYPNIGVSRNQSSTATSDRINKGIDTSYMLQDVTKIALLGISPVSNRHVFMCYHQPTFVYEPH